MAEFERGDVVVYAHPNAPVGNHGALAIVVRIRDGGLVDVEWFSLNGWLMEIFEHTEQDERFWSTNWEPVSFEKIGHIDLPPAVPHE